MTTLTEDNSVAIRNHAFYLKIKEQIINKRKAKKDNDQKKLQIVNQILKCKKQISEDEMTMEYLVKSMSDTNKQYQIAEDELTTAKEEKHNLFIKLKKLMKEEQLYLYREKK